MITYNHQAYIGEAIESIVSQKVNFDFELVIGEDHGTDNTRAICEQYAARYPKLIKLLPSDKNYGPMGNCFRVLDNCTGRYIAMCEGDDCWTDPYKLQKQVDFLEANPDYSICFSAVEIRDELGWQWPDEKYFPPLSKTDFTIEDFIYSDMNIIPTPTLMFRNVLPSPTPAFFKNAIAGDLPIQLLVADKGKAKYFPEKTAVYRNHSGGVTKSEENITRGDNAKYLLYEQAAAFFGHKYESVFRRQLLKMTKERIIYGSKGKGILARMKNLTTNFPAYLQYSDKINYKEIAYYNMILFFPGLLKMFKK